MFRTRRLWPLLLVLSAVLASELQACTKPVFRYALERWPAAPYRLVVLHQGPMDDASRRPLSGLLPEGTFDLNVYYFDVDEKLPRGAVQKNWEADPDPTRLPLALLLPPAEVETDETILWEGRVDTAGVEELREQLYSPVVRQLLKKLASGDTAVWVVIKGKDETKNRKARKLLDRSLAKLQEELKLPHEQDPQDSEYDDGLAPGIPMRMSFSVIEADLNEPANRLLKASLLANAAESLEQPGVKVMPVFARGRGLALLYGEEISEEVFRDITQFLVGPCSCRVKELNPGFDLLAPFPWDWVLFEETDLATVMKQLPNSRTGTSKTAGDAE